ncbi:fimbria/pilus periplasmic chaperone [Burkholderia cenocepacia]|uniref:fimbria/pilus chaperone family protein n=1 Tax=Burkholderia cenocepacia TaxID=95486 RepID=UPI00078B8FB8|nr:fimbria/pilus chaperone family protein [Burkholderia cenocepacia]AMU14628.1 fimbrial chaperone protein [Burkholderia cenocepacia]MCW3587659.1 fimbria/pilus periplasmic chaperone [Burkholderia cenocepacia]MCW3632503.1 fimbria/pilus periplasmic chaperone [Burkholderia cenocepacia]MCW3647531.1 fimbria/pilus periplasmic chaperone [Burkholderia cenocepacia]MCW5182488.1 fimbria/pilus periplasmic chaperone [Burkholderia cenocepacia]
MTLPALHFPRFFPLALLAGCLLGPAAVHAMGVVPETSVVIVDEADGEGTISVKNTDDHPTLLHTTIEPIPEDDAVLVVVTPPIARVEGGAVQLVRFVLASDAPLATQRLARASFSGIPPQRPGRNEIRTIIRQNLPVLIQPRDLARNDSRYVVRLEQKVQLLPTRQIVSLPAPYVLAGQTRRIALAERPQTLEQVRIFPATVYGYSVDHYDAALAPRAADAASHW